MKRQKAIDKECEAYKREAQIGELKLAISKVQTNSIKEIEILQKKLVQVNQ